MTFDVRPYLSARETTLPTIAPDGTLAFLSDVTGTTQVWTLEAPGAWPTQRTFYDERVSFVAWSPDGDYLAFGKDAGADEHDQLFRLDPGTGEIAQLTDRPDAIHAWGGFSPDGERIAFAANRENPARFDAYVMDVASGGGEASNRDEASDSTPEPTRLTDGQGRFLVEGWSPGGDRLVVREANSSADDDLSIVHVESRTCEHVTPHEGDVKYREPVFGPAGETLYCLSDANADTLELVRLDLDSLVVETVFEGGEWNVDGFAFDPASGRLALTRNVDGYSDLSVGRLDGETSVTLTDVDVPEGVVSELAFNPNGKRVAATVTTPTLNPSIFVVDLGVLEADRTPPIERWTDPSAGGVPPEEYDEPELVRYETFDGREIPAYVTFPDGAGDGSNGVDGASDTANHDDGVPVIVDVHGGPHHQRRPWFRPVRQYFLDAGYAVFEPNVRGSSGYGREYAALDDVELRMNSVRDLAAAVDWLQERPAVDPDGIVAYGRSYGGFMVLAAITEYPDLWAAAVDFVGIANWVTFLENTGEWRRAHREAEYGSLEDDREFLESISPIHAVDEIECPLFVQHGENDPRVPVGEARQIVSEVEAQGIPVESLVFDDEGHHITKLENRLEAFERIAAFLEDHVG